MDQSLVGENVIAKLSKDIQSPEARYLYNNNY